MPRALVSASLFFMDVTSNIGLAQEHRVTYNYIDNLHPTGVAVDFDLTVPVNESAHVHGLELSWEQAVWGNFGANANMSLTSATTSSGQPMLGTSKNVYNLGGYFENDFAERARASPTAICALVVLQRAGSQQRLRARFGRRPGGFGWLDVQQVLERDAGRPQPEQAGTALLHAGQLSRVPATSTAPSTT